MKKCEVFGCPDEEVDIKGDGVTEEKVSSAQPEYNIHILLKQAIKTQPHMW